MIVGLLGLRGSGKNTVANLMQRKAQQKGYSLTEIAFADKLKRIVMNLYRFTEEQTWGSDKEKLDTRYPRQHTFKGLICVCCGASVASNKQCYLTARYAQQIFGTEAGRHCYSDTWVSATLGVSTQLMSGGCSYSRVTGVFRSNEGPQHSVITDVRFESEVDAILAVGGKVYRVLRAGFEKPAFDHPSETEQMSISDECLTGVIRNYGTIQELENQIPDNVLG